MTRRPIHRSSRVAVRSAPGLLGLLCLSLLTACGQPGYHIVRPGETLYAISWRYARDYQKLAAWNGLSPPYHLEAGQRIRLAPGPVTPAVRAPGPAKVTHRLPRARPSASPAAAAAPTRAPVTKRASTDPAPAKRASTQAPATVHWTWPSRARLVHGFTKGAEGVSGSGLDFTGKAGMPVLSAAAGRVVYSGQGIPSYGRLVIIKHSDEYLSAYAHNRRLLVKEGDRVRAGQKIAEMGASGTGTKRVMLHFEIRRHGRPVDPLSFLPRR